MFIERQPMGRLGTAEEMAHIAVYLASDESAYMTGSAIVCPTAASPFDRSARNPSLRIDCQP